MLTFPKYKIMRKYTVDVFSIIRRKRNSKLFDLFRKAYKERFKRRFTSNLVKNKTQYFNYLKNIRKTIKLGRRFGFFEYATASPIYDKESVLLSFYGYWLSQYKLFTNFYNNLSINVLKRLWNKACSSRISTFNCFLFLLESRIDSIIIRMNWIHSKHMVRQALRKMWFLVNGYPVYYTNHILSNFSYVTPHKDKMKYTFDILKHRLQKKQFFYKPPYFLEINYKILTCLVVQNLVKKTFVKYPFSFSSDSLRYLSYSKR